MPEDEMQKPITFEVIDHTGGGGVAVLFHSHVHATDGPYRSGLVLRSENMVNLSRAGLNPACWLPVTNLQGHDWHSPGWSSGQAPEKAAYIQRVQEATEAACARIEEAWAKGDCPVIPPGMEARAFGKTPKAAQGDDEIEEEEEEEEEDKSS